MDDLLQRIRTIHQKNEEIIVRVESITEVLLYEYHFKPKKAVDDIFVLEEVCKKVKVQNLIQEFKPTITLRTNIWDIFNDKPNWTCSSWHDLKRLNKELRAITDQFEILDKNNAKLNSELTKYLHNLEIIQTGLDEFESKTVSDKSRLSELLPCVEKLNAILSTLKKDGVSFKFEKESTSKQHTDPRVNEMKEILTTLKKGGVGTTRRVPGFDGGLNAPRNPCYFGGGSVLNNDHSATLTEWYGGGWTLIYKASRDGWLAKNFHTKCDGKGETVTVIKSGDNIFGGHLGKHWHCHVRFIDCKNASLFTLVNAHGIEPTKFDVKGEGTNAAFGVKERGPCFGGGDLYIANNANINNESRSDFPHSYQDTTGKGNTLFAGAPDFKVTEIEVYCRI